MKSLHVMGLYPDEVSNLRVLSFSHLLVKSRLQKKKDSRLFAWRNICLLTSDVSNSLKHSLFSVNLEFLTDAESVPIAFPLP